MVTGLNSDEALVFERLEKQLRRCRPRNELRTAHMDGKHVSSHIPPTVPDYISRLGLVLGWPGKAVEALSRRAKLEGFALPGDDLARWGLEGIIAENDYIRESRIAHGGSLEHGVMFLVSSAGGAGEPDALITRRSALDGTGEWNHRTRHLDNFLSVTKWKNGNPEDFNLYLPGVVIVRRDGDVGRFDNRLPRIPVEPLVYRARDGRPFGSSRISRPIMSITRSAVRTVMRSEGTADFYSAPIIALLGASESTFGDAPRLKMLMSQMFGIPDDETADDGLQRVDMKQIQQASQEPHVKQLEVWAQLFAAEANIPVSSLGIGMVQANPTSAEAYHASREDLIDEAEDTTDGWSLAHVRAVQNAWMIAAGENSVPDGLRGLIPVWRDPRHPSKAAEADWMTKVASVIPWIAESDTALGLLGVRPDVAERLRADRARQSGRSMLRALAGGDE